MMTVEQILARYAQDRYREAPAQDQAAAALAELGGSASAEQVRRAVDVSYHRARELLEALVRRGWARKGPRQRPGQRFEVCYTLTLPGQR